MDAINQPLLDVRDLPHVHLLGELAAHRGLDKFARPLPARRWPVDSTSYRAHRWQGDS